MVWKAKIVEKLSPAEIFLSAFLSSVLTYISLGYFTRLGWLLSISGAELLSSVCVFATLICAVTTFSIAWMLSNIKIEKDSIYFLLARTFGVDVAFAISAPLFISQALSASFYILGIAEILHYVFPFIPTLVAAWSCFALVGILACFNAQFLFKGEIAVFLLIIATLASVFFNPSVKHATSIPSLSNLGFWNTFALFFPLVTGIESVVSSECNKKFSAKAFASGAISGLCVSLSFYLVLIYFFHHYVSYDALKNDPLIVNHLSLLPSICIITALLCGILAAYNALQTASLTCKSLAEDAQFFSFFQRSSFYLGLPLFMIAAGLVLGNINTLSSFLTLFFLISYGMINTATGLEAWIGNPSWRPSLKGHFSICILGALGCFITTLMISPGFGLISTCLVACLYFLIKSRKITSSWDDFRYSILLFAAKSIIYKLNYLLPSPKTWRPNLLVFIGDPLLRTHLTQLSCDITHKKGFLIFSSILPDKASLNYENKKLNLFLEKKHIPGLVKIQSAHSLIDGMKSLIENIGLGSLSPNTIVLGASEKQEKIAMIAELIQFIHRTKKNLVLIKESSLEQSVTPSKTIHVWWGAKHRTNSELVIILSHMLKTSAFWNHAKIILNTVVNTQEQIEPTQQLLIEFMEQSRVFFDTNIILHEHGDIFETTIKENATSADLVFLGLRAPDPCESIEDYGHYYSSLMKKTQGFPAIAFVLAGEPLEFDKVLL